MARTTEAAERRQQFDDDLARMRGEDIPKGPSRSDLAKQEFEADLAKMNVGREAKPPSAPALPVARFSNAAHARGETMCGTFPSDWAFEDVLKPGTWRLLATRLAVGSHIEVRNDSLTWWGLLLVVASDHARGVCEVRQLQRVDLAPAEQLGDDVGEFYTEDRGVTDKFVIIRHTDKKIMKTGLKSRTDALHEIRTMTPRPLG